jgi:excinuclease UvrABC ATPase subunit
MLCFPVCYCCWSGELASIDYKVHVSSVEPCTFMVTGACTTCAGARKVMLWPKSVMLCQPKKMRSEPAQQVLQHYATQLQLLGQQQAAGHAADSELAAFAVLQPCAEYITAVLEAVEQVQEQQQQQRQQKRQHKGTAANPSAATTPAAANDTGVLLLRLAGCIVAC